MSERRFDDSPAPDDERALREAWQGDAPPAPDAALDARVRAAVQAELAAEVGAALAPTSATSATIIRPARWQRLRIPLALAATVLLSFGAVRMMFPTAVAPQPVALDREQADSAARLQSENDAVFAPAAPPLEPASAKASSAQPVAEPPSAAEQSRAAPRKSAERHREAAAADATQPAAPTMSKALPAASPPAAADSAPAGSAPAVPAAPPAPAAESALGALRDAPPAAFMKGRGAPAGALPSMAPPLQRADARAEDSENPAAVLARIRAQLDKGERVAAARALEEWVKAHPQAELPDWARALLVEAKPLLP